jgi:glycogen operon protein
VRDAQSYLFWYDQNGEPMTMERWNDPRNRVVQLLLGSDDGQAAGLIVVNGGRDDVPVTLPQATNDDGTAKRIFELRLTTSDLHDQRQGVQVVSGDADVVQANTINIYRT